MKKIVLTKLLLFSILTSPIAQTKIGWVRDASGYAFNGYYDAINYSPKQAISFSHSERIFEKGRYYDLEGKRHDGYIELALNCKSISFKENDNFTTKIKIKPKEISSFVIGLDSFIVAKDFNFSDYGSALRTKPAFVKIIGETTDYVFAKYFFRGNQRSSETYLLQDNDRWISFESKSKFKKLSKEYFSHLPYVIQKIKDKKYKKDDLLTIIKLFQYDEYYKNKQPIYFNKYWQEIQKSSKAKYKALIVDKKDSIWTLDYWDNQSGKKLYTANYSSFYPNNRNGEFVIYDEDGQIRRREFYEDDKITKNTIFENGKLKKESVVARVKKKDFATIFKKVSNDFLKGNNKYPWLEERQGIEREKLVEYDIDFYKVVMGENEVNRVEKEPSFTLEALTSNGTKLTENYENYRLKSISKTIGKEKVNQIVSTDLYSFNSKKINKKLVSFMESQEYKEAITENVQGYLLLYLLINPDKTIREYKFLNKLHPEIDKLYDDFVKKHIIDKQAIKFKPLKIDKVNQLTEVVIPLEFVVSKFYTIPIKANYNMHYMFFQNMMQQPLNLPPPVRVGF